MSYEVTGFSEAAYWFMHPREMGEGAVGVALRIFLSVISGVVLLPLVFGVADFFLNRDVVAIPEQEGNSTVQKVALVYRHQLGVEARKGADVRAIRLQRNLNCGIFAPDQKIEVKDFQSLDLTPFLLAAGKRLERLQYAETKFPNFATLLEKYIENRILQRIISSLFYQSVRTALFKDLDAANKRLHDLKGHEDQIKKRAKALLQGKLPRSAELLGFQRRLDLAIDLLLGDCQKKMREQGKTFGEVLLAESTAFLTRQEKIKRELPEWKGDRLKMAKQAYELPYKALVEVGGFDSLVTQWGENWLKEKIQLYTLALIDDFEERYREIIEGCKGDVVRENGGDVYQELTAIIADALIYQFGWGVVIGPLFKGRGNSSFEYALKRVVRALICDDHLNRTLLKDISSCPALFATLNNLLAPLF